MTRLLAIFATALLINPAFSQQVDREQIYDAIKMGNAKKLASYFSGTVDLTIGKVEEVYSKEQAEVIMARFFTDHPPKAFTLRHEGKSKLDDYFYIGDLTTTNTSYRVTFFLKKEEPAFRIRQLRIESE